MAIEHDYFGIIGDYWSERVPAGDQDVEVVVDADPATVSMDALDIAAGMIVELEVLDAEAREAFVSELASGSSATSAFVAALLEQLDADTLADAVDRESGDAQIDVLRSLELLRVDIRPGNDGDEEAFASFEYALAPDETDVRIVAILDARAEVVSVDAQL
ncbi:DUF2004 domain-containing protein [Rathayibacter sp. YIM 133350]|uniref:DUF2004 domain-containing protein n=1 Tax=Rathayibacter sp. YIM 133350 TaxID=3131992 RepID=UPI00307E21BB